MLRSLFFGLALSLATVSISDARPAPDGFVELTKRLSPAVVNISTAQTVAFGETEIPAFPEGSPLERFNDFFGNRPGRDGRVSKS
ncbi:MAG: serine protease, partial [Pseudomonadota bacterium]